MDKAVAFLMEKVFDLPFFTGHRTQIANGWFQVTSFLMAYQAAATQSQYAAQLPDLHWIILGFFAAGCSFFGLKVPKFAREHKEKVDK